MKAESSLKVFVYGTLKPGEANFDRYCQRFVESQTIAYTKGVLYSLPVGYPAMAEGDSKVKGVLMTFRDTNILANLDSLEDYQPQRDSQLNLYYRLLVPVYDLGDRLITQAWAYFMTLEKIKKYSGKVVESGWWEG